MNHRPSIAPPDGSASDSGPRRSLILAGGGMRVAYQAGVIRALFESGLTFAHADGTSGGTINLAMLFSGLSPVEMCDRWRTLNVKHFASAMPLEEYLKPHDMLAVGDADGIVKHVFPHLGIEVAKINAAAGMEGTFNVCNYTRKTNEAVPHERVDLDFLIAGISLPIFMPPVLKGGDLYLDSVWIKDANLMEAVRRGSEELWVVWCIGNSSEYRKGFFHQYVHMIELSANGALFEEFDRISEINERIRRGETVYGHTQPIRLHLIRPEYPLPLDPDFFLGRIDAATLIAMGYADAKRYLSTMKPEGLPLQPEITKMKDTVPGITFRETMAGGFSLGETDPRTGEQKGKAAGHIMAMHATITIQDLDRFISDPGHTGGINGSIDFPPFGENIPAKAGVFNLFSPAGDAGMKLMVYELAFEHGGKNYYLAGHKEVKDDPGLDLWKDTTTLFATLHYGDDKSGPVAGAGILSLGPLALAKMVTTMHSTNTSSTIEGMRVVGRFGKFFLGELWDSYIAKVRS